MDIEAKNELAKQIAEDQNTKYFLIKSYSNENIGKSLQWNVWATCFRNEKKLDEAYNNSPHVILVFSVNGSSRFSGYASMKSRPGQSKVTERIFCGPDGSPFPGKMFDLYWVRQDCDHITNSLNEYKPVKIGRDGQELSSDAGKALCKIIDIKSIGGVLAPPPNRRSLKWENPENRPHLEKQKDPQNVLQNLAALLKPNAPEETEEADDAGEEDIQQQNYTSFIKQLQRPPKDDEADFYWKREGNANYDTEQLLEANPALSIFPIDLTSISFSEYTSLYRKSQTSCPGNLESMAANYPFDMWLKNRIKIQR
eukprot:GHVP01051465.1.p2 GENE.GHVP01051465.1~~GHVP01051465.1.p2  ORF type:complete len:311 (-),score=57.95 GHVP01051465.1:78-1010(-)